MKLSSFIKLSILVFAIVISIVAYQIYGDDYEKQSKAMAVSNAIIFLLLTRLWGKYKDDKAMQIGFIICLGYLGLHAGNVYDEIWGDPHTFDFMEMAGGILIFVLMGHYIIKLIRSWQK